MDIKDYLHLYIGCDVELIHDKSIATLCGFSYDEFGKTYVHLLQDDTYFVVFANEIKLFLQKLSGMTEEERYAMQFETQCFFDSNQTNHPIDYHHYEIHEVAALINSYRKAGFDCDKLIEAGLAIDKTTTK